jgi:hypothetical protein
MQQYPETMTDLPQLYSLDGKPSGPNCGGLYPSAKGCREYFSADVETAVHIGMNGGTPFDTIPAAISAAREMRFVFLIHALSGIIGGQDIEVQEAGFARVTLFGDLCRHILHPLQTEGQLRRGSRQLQRGP